MGKQRILFLHRLIADYRAGLSKTKEEELICIIDELLDEVEVLRALAGQCACRAAGLV